MSHRFLAVCLYVFAGFTFYLGIREAAAERRRDLPVAVWGVIITAIVTAVLANAGADLWGTS